MNTFCFFSSIFLVTQTQVLIFHISINSYNFETVLAAAALKPQSSPLVFGQHRPKPIGTNSLSFGRPPFCNPLMTGNPQGRRPPLAATRCIAVSLHWKSIMSRLEIPLGERNRSLSSTWEPVSMAAKPPLHRFSLFIFLKKRNTSSALF